MEHKFILERKKKKLRKIFLGHTIFFGLKKLLSKFFFGQDIDLQDIDLLFVEIFCSAHYMQIENYPHIHYMQITTLQFFEKAAYFSLYR